MFFPMMRVRVVTAAYHELILTVAFTAYTRMNFLDIKDVNVKGETQKVVEEIIKELKTLE